MDSYLIHEIERPLDSRRIHADGQEYEIFRKRSLIATITVLSDIKTASIAGTRGQHAGGQRDSKVGYELNP